MWKILLSDHLRFSSIASGIQSYVVAVSILFGGLWTLHSFDALWSAELATFNARESRDREDALEFIVRADAVTTYTRTKGKNGRITTQPLKVIIACVDISNVGLRTQRIRLDSVYPITISHYHQATEEAMNSSYSDPIIGTGRLPTGSAIVIAPKTKTTRCYDHAIIRSGLYSIHFEVPAVAVGNALKSTSDAQSKAEAVYQAQTYLNVGLEPFLNEE